MKAETKKGGYRKTEFGDLMKSNPQRAAQTLRGAWISEGGATGAAKLLGISRCSFFRCARRLEEHGFSVRRVPEVWNAGIDTGSSVP